MARIQPTSRRQARAETGGSAGEQTRLALIEAALARFGRAGFEGASTRDIANDANANIGSIAYHFGGKEGLYSACAQYIVDRAQLFAAPVLAAAPDPARLDPDQARATLAAAVDRICGFVLSTPDARLFVAFVLREMDRPTAAFETIYSGVFEPVHLRLCKAWAAATGDDADSEATRLHIFALIGQIVYFRIGAEAVRRRMGWPAIGPMQASHVAETVKSNLLAVLAPRRKGKP